MAAVFLAPVLAQLVQGGLGLLAGAIQAKGKQVIEQKLGVTIPETVDGLTPDKLAELRQAQMRHEEFLIQAPLQAEQAANQQVSDRWKADMASDSWLSKNVRPLTLVVLVLLIVAMVIADAAGQTFDAGTYALVSTAISIVFAAYFVGRSLEKGVHVWKGGDSGRSGS